MIRCDSCGEVFSPTADERCPSCGAQAFTPFRPAPSLILAGPRYRLLLTTEGEGASLALGEAETIIGRSERAGFRVAFPMVSRRHAAVWVEQGVAYIRDLDSQQGTFVNDRKVVGQTAIRPGDRVSLGPNAHFQLIVDEAEEDTAVVRDAPVHGSPRTVGAGEQDGAPSHLELLARFCSLCAKLPSEEELFAAVLDHLQRMIPADRYSVMRGTVADGLSVVAQRSSSSSAPGPPPSRGILRRVMYSLSDSPFVTCDAQGEKGLSERSSVVLNAVRSVMCVALIVGPSCEGVLYLDSDDRGVPFTAADEQFLHVVALTTASRLALLRAAAETAVLRAELEQRKERSLKPVDLT